MMLFDRNSIYQGQILLLLMSLYVHLPHNLYKLMYVFSHQKSNFFTVIYNQIRNCIQNCRFSTPFALHITLTPSLKFNARFFIPLIPVICNLFHISLFQKSSDFFFYFIFSSVSETTFFK